MFNEINKPYDWDLPLFKELGLNPFEAKNWEKTFVGEVIENDYYKIKIWVTCAPAQFWEFEVFNNDAKETTKFKTGSGDFGKYWNVAKLFAEGMIDILSVGKKEKDLKD